MLSLLALFQSAKPDVALVPQVGAILRAYGRARHGKGWDVPARMQDLWLAKPARTASRDHGFDFGDVAYARETGLTLDWLLSPDVDSDRRAKRGYDALIGKLVGESTRDAVRTLALARLGGDKDASFGDTRVGPDSILPVFHAQHVAEQGVGPDMKALRIDPELAALGHFAFYAVPVGRAERRGDGTVHVDVARFLVYALDSFDFSKPFEPLGFFKAPDTISTKPGEGTLLTNQSYRDYRTATGRGGDFLVITDLCPVRRQLAFDIPAR